MKKLLIAFFVAITLLTRLEVDAAEISPEFSEWLSKQGGIQTFQADFIQSRHLKTLTQPLISTGKVWFAAPSSFRWEIGSPAQTIAVKQGDTMQVAYPRLKRVEKYEMTSAMGQWKDALSLLEAGFPRSEKDIQSRFNVLRESNSNEVHRVEMQPRGAAKKFMPLLAISFSMQTKQLLGTELEFSDGSVMKNQFFNSSTNLTFAADTFLPEFPKDFKTVEPLKSK